MSDQPRRRRGRPSKFVPERTQAIVQSVANGADFTTACAAADVDDSTAHAWLRRADAEPDGPYGEFRRQVVRARASWEQRCISIVMGAADAGDWRAALEMLQRRAPDRWALTHKLQVNTDAVHQMTELVLEVVKAALEAALPDRAVRDRALDEVLDRLAALPQSPEVRALPPMVR